MSKIGMLRDALRELLAEHERDDALPTSGRFLFYELVQRRRAVRSPESCATFIAPILRPFHRILYLGDHDLCGNLIEENTRRVLERKASELCWERLALTQEQVDRYELPVIIKHDRRYKDGAPHEAVETEALSQRIIVEILRNRLDELLPEPLERVLERESQQRVVIQRALESLA